MENKERVVDASVATDLGRNLSKKLDEYKKGRRNKERVWLEDSKQYHAVYDKKIIDDITSSIGKHSTLFPNVTRGKINQVKAKMVFMLNDMSFDIEPSEIPEIPEEDLLSVYQKYSTVDPETQEVIEPEPEQVLKGVRDIAKHRAGLMKNQIKDQLTETKYDYLRDTVIDSTLKIGTAFLKGPLPKSKKKKTYLFNRDEGSYELKTEDIKVPYLEAPSTWNIYLDPESSYNSSGDGIFERHRMSRDGLKALINDKFFLKESINKILSDIPQGNAKREWYEDELKKNTNEEIRDSGLANKYDIYEYWGLIPKNKARSCGCNVGDSDGEFIEAHVWLVGDEVIKVVENPDRSWEDIYHISYFEDDERSPYGISLARVMKGSADGICSTVRLLMDNAAYSATQMLEINTQMLEDGEDPRDVRPFKVWLRTGRAQESQARAIHDINFESKTNELLSIMKLFMDLMEQETGFSNGGDKKIVHNENKAKTSIRAGEINLTTAYTVHKFDQKITKQLIESLYHWNMQFNTSQDIKGDFSVKVSGYRSLVAKEVLSNALTEIRHSLSESDWDYINRSKYLEQLMFVHDTPELMNTQEEIISNQEARQQQQQQVSESEAQANNAKAQEVNAKAEKLMSEATLNEEKAVTEQTSQLLNIATADEKDEVVGLKKEKNILDNIANERKQTFEEAKTAFEVQNQQEDNKRLKEKVDKGLT